MAERVRIRPFARVPRLVAGVDSTFTPDERCIAAVVLWDVRERAVVEECVATRPLRFPYVPGLLSFREGPAILAALRRLRRRPDALMCDGHGLAHPRRFGIACHLGVITQIPAIGCAKSRLTGEHAEPGLRRGSRAPLRDGDEVIGTVLRTRDGVRPIYVSVGHLCDLRSAERLTLACATGTRLPQPTHLADRLVARERRKLLDEEKRPTETVRRSRAKQ
jgi:deoxyribonuclease V